MDIARFVATLQRWQGTPFHHQGRGPQGADCVGLVLAALGEQGIHVDAPADYAPGAAAVVLLAELQRFERAGLIQQRSGPPEAGDVLVFRIRRDAQHLAIALGPDRMIHAVRGAGVVAVTISALWRVRLLERYGWCHGH